MNESGASVRTGRIFEHKACRYLQKQGLILIEQNYHCHRGEIDLIMRDGDYLVFIEVRYRRLTTYGSAVESIDRHKQRRLLSCAERYLQQQHTTQAVRFDVISFSLDRRGETLQWIQDAFQAEQQLT